jgi:hypothetical protein
MFGADLGLEGGALATDAGHELTVIDLGTNAPAAGLYLIGEDPWSATVSFFDASHNLLATEFLGETAPGAVFEFAGWSSNTGLIHEIDIRDTSAAVQNQFFKDLTTGTPAAASAAPEPASAALLGIGLTTCLVFIRRRKS